MYGKASVYSIDLTQTPTAEPPSIFLLPKPQSHLLYHLKAKPIHKLNRPNTTHSLPNNEIRYTYLKNQQKL